MRAPLPLAHPIAVAAVVALVANDHVLKHEFPGPLTGKLSDVAGLIFFPLLLLTLVPARLRDDAAPHGKRALAAACIATAVAFALVKTTVLGNDVYRVVWGAMQWPLRAVRACALGRPVPSLSRVTLVRDASDLIALPFVLVAFRIGSGRRACPPRSETEERSLPR